jgi:hypothetical protein
LDHRIAHVWDWFRELDATRGGNGWGVNPITFAEIDAYQRLTGEQITAWAARLIRAVDNAVLIERAKQDAKK